MTFRVKVVDDESYKRFLQAPAASWWGGVRVDAVCHKPLEVGGRCVLRLFADVEGRSHPRLRLKPLAIKDPLPRKPLFSPTTLASTAAEFRRQVSAALASNRPLLDGDDLSAPDPRPGRHYRRNSVSTQRKNLFFREVRSQLKRCERAGSLETGELATASSAIKELEDQAYSGEMLFDDDNIGTNYDYKDDHPFVHYLEQLLSTLPRPGTEAHAILRTEARASVDRHRIQAQNHLDYLVRFKYAHDGVRESDIERSAGVMLIDRNTRRVVSHTAWDAESNGLPSYYLLRISRSAAEHAGAWIYEDGETYRLQDGSAVKVDPGDLRKTPVAANQLALRRAPGDQRLRAGIHLDWDRNGYITDDPLPWVEWAGHCDVQAVMEQTGLTFSDAAEVQEYRSDIDRVVVHSRTALREMVASVVHHGSAYHRTDSGERVNLVHRKQAGFRSWGRSDVLEFEGADAGRKVSWPGEVRKGGFLIRGLQGEQGKLEPESAFLRHLADPAGLEILPNPRYLKSRLEIFNYIDPVGLELDVCIVVDTYDPRSGYYKRKEQSTVVDLRRRPQHRRCLLGTRLWKSARREIFHYYLDRSDESIVAELYRHLRREGRWQAVLVPEYTRRTRLKRPLSATLRREVMRDDPMSYYPLIKRALRHGEPINADTDMGQVVWNGLVTRLDAKKLRSSPKTGVEQWQVEVDARHGKATIDLLLRRGANGEVTQACPVQGPHGWRNCPDFFWQHYPDVGTLVQQDKALLVNLSMLGTGVISHTSGNNSDGDQVFDDHIRQVHEVLYCAQAPYPWTILHDNRRYGYREKEAWMEARTRLARLRASVRFK